MMTTQTLTRPEVRFLNLAVDEGSRTRLLAAMQRVLEHGRLLLGPEVERFETAMARRCGVAHAVGVSSGTCALYFALRALGVGPGDEVITTSMSFIATANAIAMTGATPVFVDLADDLNMDATLIEAAVTPATRAVLPVHYTGRVCDMDAIGEIASRRGLAVIEDASQAFGAMWRGRPVGSVGDAGCISLNPMKLLAACGEAGVVVTDNEELAERVVGLRYNGLVDREDCHWVSMNGRLDTLQAAILIERLRTVDEVIARRDAVARRYDEALSRLVRTPARRGHARDVYYTYTVQTERRDELKAHLERCGVEAKVYHPRLMPEHAAYRGSRGQWANASRLAGQILCLPVHEKLTDAEVDHVIDSVRAFFGG